MAMGVSTNCLQLLFALEYKPVEGLTTEEPTILICSLTGLSILISMERKQMFDKH
jgi:hypothetical protein